MTPSRRWLIGADPDANTASTHFRVWAPVSNCVELMLEDSRETVSLTKESAGYFSSLVPKVEAAARYRFLLDGKGPFPDPASRFQPDGPDGPSMVVDSTFPWSDTSWTGVKLEGQVLYEMHIGTFTPEGTWSAAAQQLPELAACGITCLEIMPVAEFVGNFGWGYDGVNLFAPTRLYGTPDDFRRFVNTAHMSGLGVILDVVYNHLGPDGNYLGQFAADYFTDDYKTDWGRAINFDGQNCGPVREYFLTNAQYWIREFHLDGLRLDATQNIYDKNPVPKHILTDIGHAVRKAAGGRSAIIINENESQHSELVRPHERGGYGLDALWNDDYHHTAMVALTGKAEAYYKDYHGSPQEFVSAAKYGYLYQGQWYSWQKQRRGHPGFDLPPAAFVNFLQNHDQIANSAHGLRAHQLTSPGRYRALHALTLLLPGTPMLFQGQEFEASAPFLFFADHEPDLAEKVHAGRGKFLEQFVSVKQDRAMRERLRAPHHDTTFEHCKLNFAERQTHAAAYLLTKNVLTLRRTESAFRGQTPRGVDGAVLGANAFVIRYFAADGQDLLLLVNLGRELLLETCPEPLLAPLSGCKWTLLFSTDSPQYGGGGATLPDTVDRGWRLPGESATVLKPARRGGDE